jgi:hypothetical protein
MRAFIIHVNGRKICTAGIGEGVLTANAALCNKPSNLVGHLPGYLLLQIGGLDTATNENVNWDAPDLNVGDEITIKIVDAPQVDPEHHRFKAKP